MLKLTAERTMLLVNAVCDQYDKYKAQVDEYMARNNREMNEEEKNNIMQYQDLIYLLNRSANIILDFNYFIPNECRKGGNRK